jgi:hypothetical protein
MANKKKAPAKRDQRKMRTQQIVFGVIAVILILSWVISLVSNY